MFLKKILAFFRIIGKTIKYAIECEKELAQYKRFGYKVTRQQMKWIIKNRIEQDGWNDKRVQEYQQEFGNAK